MGRFFFCRQLPFNATHRSTKVLRSKDIEFRSYPDNLNNLGMTYTHFKQIEEPIYRPQISRTRANRSTSCVSSNSGDLRESYRSYQRGKEIVEVELEDTPPLLEGESVKGFYKGIEMVSQHMSEKHIPIGGDLVITNYKLYFKSNRCELRNGSPKPQFPSALLNMPLGFIKTIKKMGNTDEDCGDHSHGIRVDCKDMRWFKFIMDKPCDSTKRNSKTSTPKTFGQGRGLKEFLFSKLGISYNLSRQKSRSIE